MAIKSSEGLFKPELWSKLLLRVIMDYGVMFDCVNRNWEGEIKNQGDTVHIQAIGDINVSTYSDSTPITYQDPDGDSLTLLIDQQKYFAFKVNDIDKVQSNVELMTKYTNKSKKSIVNVKDAYLHSLGMAGAAAANQAGTTAITPETIYGLLTDMFTLLSRSNALDKQGLGEDGKRPFLILPPEVIAVIKKSEEAKNATTLGDQTIRKGAIMQYAGFDIKQATTVKNSSGFAILAGTAEGITYADQITKIESLRDKDSFGDYVRGLYVYGAKVVEPKALATATFTIAGLTPGGDGDTDSDSDSDTDTDTDVGG